MLAEKYNLTDFFFVCVCIQFCCCFSSFLKKSHYYYVKSNAFKKSVFFLGFLHLSCLHFMFSFSLLFFFFNLICLRLSYWRKFHFRLLKNIAWNGVWSSACVEFENEPIMAKRKKKNFHSKWFDSINGCFSIQILAIREHIVKNRTIFFWDFCIFFQFTGIETATNCFVIWDFFGSIIVFAKIACVAFIHFFFSFFLFFRLHRTLGEWWQQIYGFWEYIVNSHQKERNYWS